MSKEKKRRRSEKTEANKPNSTYWKTKADRLWSCLVRVDNKCAYSRSATKGDSCKGRIEAHHLQSRDIRETRYGLANGLPLCSKHHKWGKVFSAHKTPFKLYEWLKRRHTKLLKMHSQPDSRRTYKEEYERLKLTASSENIPKKFKRYY